MVVGCALGTDVCHWIFNKKSTWFKVSKIPLSIFSISQLKGWDKTYKCNSTLSRKTVQENTVMGLSSHTLSCKQTAVVHGVQNTVSERLN